MKKSLIDMEDRKQNPRVEDIIINTTFIMADAIDILIRDAERRMRMNAESAREEAFADWYLKNGKGTPTYSDAIEWARKQTIDEAYKWVDKCLHFFVMKNHINYTALEQEFRKAMEE